MKDKLDLDIVKDGIDYFMDFRIEELKSDADYYSLMWDMGSFDKWLIGICRSAKATVKAIENGTGA